MENNTTDYLKYLPNHTLHDNPMIRNIKILILISLSFFFFYFAFIGIYAFAFLGFFSLIPILFIQKSKIELFDDYFKVTRTDKFNLLTSEMEFKYQELKNIELMNGNSNLIFLFFILILPRFYMNNMNKYYSVFDYMVITSIDNQITNIARIGRKSDFKDLIEMIRVKCPRSRANPFA